MLGNGGVDDGQKVGEWMTRSGNPRFVHMRKRNFPALECGPQAILSHEDLKTQTETSTVLKSYT